MRPCHLRIYHGPQEDTNAQGGTRAATSVTVPLAEILPLLADAVASQRTWIGDFADDQVTISTDLYEVLLAYRHYRRPSA